MSGRHSPTPPFGAPSVDEHDRACSEVWYQRQRASAAEDRVAELQIKIAILAYEHERLRGALLRFGRHAEGCVGVCTCGLDNSLARRIA